jgi:hypothetical protein
MGRGGVDISQRRKQQLGSAAAARAAAHAHRQTEREWFSTLFKALSSDLQVDQGEFCVMQELHWSKLQAVMVVVLQVLPQVQAAHCVREFV